MKIVFVQNSTNRKFLPNRRSSHATAQLCGMVQYTHSYMVWFITNNQWKKYHLPFTHLPWPLQSFMQTLLSICLTRDCPAWNAFWRDVFLFTWARHLTVTVDNAIIADDVSPDNYKVNCEYSKINKIVTLTMRDGYCFLFLRIRCSFI